MDIPRVHNLLWPAQWKFCVCITRRMLLSTPNNKSSYRRRQQVRRDELQNDRGHLILYFLITAFVSIKEGHMTMCQLRNLNTLKARHKTHHRLTGFRVGLWFNRLELCVFLPGTTDRGLDTSTTSVSFSKRSGCCCSSGLR